MPPVPASTSTTPRSGTATVPVVWAGTPRARDDAPFVLVDDSPADSRLRRRCAPMAIVITDDCITWRDGLAHCYLAP
ncbi:hypothetical protein ACWCXX_39305 [Streptomyces sp. NPDC001732]